MIEDPNAKSDRTAENLTRKIEKCADRKMTARKDSNRSLWFGMGFFGMVGWSVAVPTLLGIMIGMWVDKRWPGSYSWTLMLMFSGLCIGCLTAWRWIRQENSRKNRQDGEQR